MVQEDDAVLRERLAALGLEQKVRLLTGADFWSLHAEPAIGLRRLVVSDGPAGVRGERWDERDPSANVPSPTALAATWDEARVERLGRLLAAEGRRKGVDVLLAPTVNLHRTPLRRPPLRVLQRGPAAHRADRRRLRARAAGRRASAPRSSTSWPTTPRPSASRSTRASASARCASCTSRRSRRSSRDAAPWAVMAAYNGVNGPTMTEYAAAARDRCKDEWGFDGRRHVRLVRRPLDRGGGQRRAGPRDARADRPVGRRPGRRGARRARSTRRRSTTRSCGILRLAARVGALEGVAPAAPRRPPWTDDEVAAELRATRGGRLRARAQRRLAAAARPRRAAPRRRARPERRGRAHAGRRQRDRLPAVHRLAARRPARRAAAAPRSRTRPACRRATRAPPVPRELLGRAGARCASSPPTARCSAPSSAPAARSPGWARSPRASRSMRRGHRGPRDAARRPRPASTWSAARAPGRFALALDGAPALRRRARRCRRTPTSARRSCPAAARRPVALAAGEALDVVLRRDAGDPSAASIFQLNVEPPPGADDDGARARRRAGARGRRRDRRRRHDAGGRERGLRPHLAGAARPPGRARPARRRGQPAHGRRRQRGRAGAAAVGRTRCPAVLLAWFPGQEVGQRARRRAARRGRARRPAADHLAGVRGRACRRRDARRRRRSLRRGPGHRLPRRRPRRPLLPFGHGLGYTTWEYLGDGAATPRPRARAQHRRARRAARSCRSTRRARTARSSARRAGSPASRRSRPTPGEEVVVDVAARAARVRSTGTAAGQTEPGTFVLEAGRSGADLRLSARLTTG